MRLSVAERFWAKVERIPLHPCWEWMGARSSNGYGNFNVGGGRFTTAHRFAYELANGPVAAALEVDHLCRNRSCVRLDHLEVVTPKENTHRGDAPSMRQRRAGQCKRGHPYTPESYYLNIGKGGKQMKVCRLCQRIRRAGYRGKTIEQMRPMPEDRTHCPQGHPYDTTNTALVSGRRVCRICRREAQRRYHERHPVVG